MPEFTHRRPLDPTRRPNPEVIQPSSRRSELGLEGRSFDEQSALLSPNGQANPIQLRTANGGNPVVQLSNDPKDVIANPDEYEFGEVAAAYAQDMDQEQSALIDKQGYGDYTGTHSDESKRDGKRLKKTDCTTYVLDILRAAFNAVGKGKEWDETFADAQRNSGSTGFKGTELMKSLQSKMGWVGVYWAPDSKSSDGEHSYSAAIANSKGTYYGIDVDKDKAVTDYRPEDSRDAEMGNMNKLRQIAFGVLAARGGSHMAMIVGGAVYEVHWSSSSDDHNLFEDTDLADWGWGSGAIVMPPDQAAKWNDA